MGWLKGWETQFGIDLGTSTTMIYQRGKGIVLNEPSVVALQKETGEIEAVGEEARALIGRTPASMEVIYPLKDGVIANCDLTTAMLRSFIRKIEGGIPWFASANIWISVPCGVTNLQKRAVEETVVHKRTKRVITIEEPLAAAIGAGLPVSEPTGSMVLDIGGGTLQVAVLSLGGIVVSHSVRRGGMSIDQDIIEYVKKTYNLVIGERTAEELKLKLGTFILPDPNLNMQVRGRDLVSGLPKTITVNSREMYHLLEDFLTVIVDAVRLTLEKCSPELAGDVMERGITACGGGALLSGLGQRLQSETKVPVHIANRPQECTVLGTGMIIDDARNLPSPIWLEADAEQTEAV